MIWKIIVYVLIIALLVLFISLNISNVTDVSLIFYTIPDVPVYLTIFISVLFGCLIMAIVFLFSNHKSKKNKKKKEALHDTVDKKFEENFADLEQFDNNKKQKKKKNK